MATDLKNQNFGVEIELTGITRETAIGIIADYYGTSSRHSGGTYDAYSAADRKNRIWKAVSDASINATHSVRGTQVPAPRDYKCEVVTPVLQYEDIEDLQNIVRLLRSKGAVANASTGIHIHVDGKDHTPGSISRLLGFAAGRQDLFYEALGITDRGTHWCKKINPKLARAMKKDSEKTTESTKRIWYSDANDGYHNGISTEHYNETRYHGINVHSFFTKGTIEFRLFNGTTHAGKIKAYIQFCLAMSAWAINAKDELFFRSCNSYTKEQKYALMNRVLIRRLGMKGKEFKTARTHLTSAFASEGTEAADTQEIA